MLKLIIALIVGVGLSLCWIGLCSQWLADHAGGPFDHWYGLPIAFAVAVFAIGIVAAIAYPFIPN